MAVFNGERYVREAIGSVLAQSFADFEFLIVDDASTDRTPEILTAQERSDSRIRLLRNESNLGPYPSLNRALTAARGSVIARQDADDVSPPDRFAVQIAALDSSPDVCLVTGWVDHFGEQDGGTNTRVRPPSWQPRLEWELMFGNVIGAGGHVMFPRVLHGEPILYSTKRTLAEDYGLWCKLTGLGRIVCPTRVVYRYRQHALSISVCKKAEQDECAAAIRREYRSRCLRKDEHPESTEDLWGFWTSDSRSLAASLRASYAHFLGIRSDFLAYVERRYGLADKTRLEAELNRATADLLGYRLYRSARMLEMGTCLDLLAIPDTRREAAQLCGKAIGQAARSFRRKLVRTPPRPVSAARREAATARLAAKLSDGS
jgi:glycosyltransferase involved in cell wall biosynthesis